MSTTKDSRFWDRASQKYARSAVADQAGYERTLERTRNHLTSGDRVLELGCGTGTTALRLADSVQSYLATDISPEMIAIARKKQADEPVAGLRFGTATAESITETLPFNAILGFSYLHLVRDLAGTLRHIHRLLATGGLFISKTPCVGDMSVFIKLALPAMRAIGKAPYVDVFRMTELKQSIENTGFDIVSVENHATKGREIRPYIVAIKK